MFCATANPSDTTFTDSLSITVPGDPGICLGDSTVVNLGEFVTNDTPNTGSDTSDVVFVVPCPGGCTLTQGYWKTHNLMFHGGASKKADPGWLVIGDSTGEGQDFFITEMSYFDVMWTAPKGNPYYNAAHQYIAAKLNTLNDAGAPPAEVAAAIAEAESLFALYLPEDLFEEIVKPNGKTQLKKILPQVHNAFKAINSTLASFNEGDYPGYPHCDEDGDSSLTLADAAVKTGVSGTGSTGEKGGKNGEVEAAAAAEEIPEVFAIGNYPNPFNPTTTLLIELPEDAVVSVIVYDALGRRVTRLVNEEMDAGYHRVIWDAGSLPSGVYFYSLQSEQYQMTKKMLLLK